MAFSTQKDFLTLNIPVNRKKSENQIKTYESCTDTRAWCMDNTKRAKYLAEIVQKMKTMPRVDGAGDGSRYFSEMELDQMSQTELVTHVLELYKNIQSKNDELKATEKLLKDASEKFDSIDEVVRENRELRKELQTSKDKILHLENTKDEKIQERLSHELIEKVELIHDLRTENTNLKSQLGAIQSSYEEISELRKRSEILDMVMNERKNLTEKMKKMDMVEDAIVRLKEKALLAEQLAEENQKMCQVLEVMKKKLQVDSSDGHQAKLEAQNRFMKDRFGQVESLVEEIAIYKAENIELHKQINDLRQKIVTLRLLETDLHQTKVSLKRREAELNDCETIIHKCMIKIDRQDMEIKIGAKRMQQLCKMQQDLEILHERVGITFGDDQDVPEQIIEFGCEKEITSGEFEETSEKSQENERKKVFDVESYEQKIKFLEDQLEMCQKATQDLNESIDLQANVPSLSDNSEVHDLQTIIETLSSDVDSYKKQIKDLEVQLETCQRTIKDLNASTEKATNDVRGTTNPSSVSEDTNLHGNCLLEISSLKEDVETWKQLKDDVERQLNDKNDELLSIKERNVLLLEDIKVCSQTKDILEEQLKEHEVIALQKSKENTSLDIRTIETEELKDVTEKLTALFNENEQLRLEIDILKSDHEKQFYSSLDLKNRFEQINTEKESCQDQLQQVMFEKESLQKQLIEIDAVTADLERERNENVLHEMQRIKELEYELERLNVQLNNETKKTKEYEELTVKTEAEKEFGNKMHESFTSDPKIIEEEELPPIRITSSETEVVRQSSSDSQIASLIEETIKKSSSQLQEKPIVDLKDIRSDNFKIKSTESVKKQHNQHQQIKPSEDNMKIRTSYIENQHSINEDCRKSFEREVLVQNQRYDTKIQEMQDLHDLEKEEVSKKHDMELDMMRIKIEALENELKKINERCKCVFETPRIIFNTDERLSKICRDVVELGLGPCLIHDLLYLKEKIENAIKEKMKIFKNTDKLDESNKRVKDIFNEFNTNLVETQDHVRYFKQLIEDEIPVKIPAGKIPFTQPVPSDGCFPSISKQKENTKGRKCQLRETNSKSLCKNNRVMGLNMAKKCTSSSKYGQTQVVYHHGHKIIKITDKSDVVHSSNRKCMKGIKLT